jgi:hypothetical protein
MNADELNNHFVEAIKAQFPHKMIKIVVSETIQVQLDETACLLSNAANKDNLLKAIAVENNSLIVI